MSETLILEKEAEILKIVKDECINLLDFINIMGDNLRLACNEAIQTESKIEYIAEELMSEYYDKKDGRNFLF